MKIYWRTKPIFFFGRVGEFQMLCFESIYLHVVPYYFHDFSTMHFLDLDLNQRIRIRIRTNKFRIRNTGPDRDSNRLRLRIFSLWLRIMCQGWYSSFLNKTYFFIIIFPIGHNFDFWYKVSRCGLRMWIVESSQNTYSVSGVSRSLWKGAVPNVQRAALVNLG